MDHEKIKRLMEVSDQREQIKLKVLYRAVGECLRCYKERSNSAHLNNWQKAEVALETFVTELWAKHFGEGDALPNIPAVVDHLDSLGWKVKKSAVYNHKKEGKIRPQQDGTFRIADVDRYAETFLKRKDGGGSAKLDRMQQDKLAAETRKTLAQAEHWENRARASSGAFVPREQHDRDLARRAALFRTDLETFARSEASEIVSLVAGDTGRIPELVTFMLGRFAGFLAGYTAEREFTIPLLPAGSDKIDEPGNDDDEEEGEDG